MSLESQIADLVTEAKGLIATFNGKKNEINAAVAAAIAAIPLNEKSFYINAISGDDKNPGTAEAPLKSLKQALYNTPAGGFVICYLQGDYVLDTQVAVNSRSMSVCSDVAGVKRKLRCNYYTTSEGSTWQGGFVAYNSGMVMLTDIQLNLPSPAGLSPAPSSSKNFVFMSNSSGGTPILPVKLSGCEVLAPSDWVGNLVAASASAIVFEASNTTFPANFGGRYISGIAAGANPASLTNVLTNLGSL